MPGLQIDITVIAALWISGMLLLVALLGVVIRVSGVPFLAALAEYKRQGQATPSGSHLQDQLVELEQRLSTLEACARARQTHSLASPSAASPCQTITAGAK